MLLVNEQIGLKFKCNPGQVLKATFSCFVRRSSEMACLRVVDRLLGKQRARREYFTGSTDERIDPLGVQSVL
ncbi:hypothetical protein [Cohaesibacter gelatinilyticus]|uniref:Uncharacterized protein n=1 Tax=Cohaesibacter gelatinilyticus TaxID=372072 RepID=A0A285NE85_9HYPH|nr:hypothetical protein [Cohaesibacter gelatinilyticus]SNZ07213.1 hypothetical protein SAMN06265368_0729 [Cohaesibacter gelatinilyticus]